MRSGYLTATPKRVTDLLRLRSVGASRTVVHFAALLGLCTSVELVSSLSHFQREKEGLCIGRDTESNQHSAATSQVVRKTCSLRRHRGSEQVQKDLLESVRAKP